MNAPRVDPRVELIAAVESLAAGNACHQGEDSAYLRRVKRGLDASHRVCALFREMKPGDWRNKHPSLIMLDFADPPALSVAEFHDHYAGEGRADALAAFMVELRSFAPSFMAFFEESRPYHDAILEPMRAWLAAVDYLPPLEDYLGLRLPHRYHWVVSPLYHAPNRHNFLYQRPDGVCDIYSVSGHRSVRDGEPEFAFEPREFTHTAWHEVAHTAVDAITLEHQRDLAPLAPLYGLMTGIADAYYRGPEGWPHMVDEHVIRAVTSRLAALQWGEEAGRLALADEKRAGFALVGPFYELLREYERERGRYPTLRAFYPRFLDLLRRMHAGAAAKAGWSR